MITAFLRKLGTLARLSEEDLQTAAALLGDQSKLVPLRRDFAREGERPRTLHLICEGWAVRHKTLADGRRQIVGLLVPGDLCDFNLQFVAKRDHSLGALTQVRVVEIPFAAIEQLMQASPRIAEALRFDSLLVAAISHEWTLNVGQRSAYERIAHLFTEMIHRLRRVGLAQGDYIDWPLTQVDLADTTGLTSVHVNRTLQQLRKDGLIALVNRRLVVPDLQRLAQAAMFNPTYLHLGEAGSSAVLA